MKIDNSVSISGSGKGIKAAVFISLMLLLNLGINKSFCRVQGPRGAGGLLEKASAPQADEGGDL